MVLDEKQNKKYYLHNIYNMHIKTMCDVHVRYIVWGTNACQ